MKNGLSPLYDATFSENFMTPRLIADEKMLDEVNDRQGRSDEFKQIS